jgi:hypothetical protein
MPEMVNTEMLLVVLFCKLSILYEHNAGIIHEDVNSGDVQEFEVSNALLDRF